MNTSRGLRWVKVCCSSAQAPHLAASLEHRGLQPRLTSAAVPHCFDLWVPEDQVQEASQAARLWDDLPHSDHPSPDSVQRRTLVARYFISDLAVLNPDRSPGAATVRDPVCGMQVSPEHAPASVQYGHATVSFCSLHCLHQFQAHPERYARMM